jgi:hypothetical protein
MITKLTKHNNHKISIHRCKPTAAHYAALRCAKCDVHIQWLSEKDYFSIMGTDINNNNNNINDNKNIIISVGKADTNNDMSSLRTSFGIVNAKGETPDSEGVRELLEVAQ